MKNVVTILDEFILRQEAKIEIPSKQLLKPLTSSFFDKNTEIAHFHGAYSQNGITKSPILITALS